MTTTAHPASMTPGISRDVLIPIGPGALAGHLTVPAGASGIVVFAHGSGSSRLSPRNQAVACTLHGAGLATLLFDLLSRQEEADDARTGHLRFDIALLARRLVAATRWLAREPDAKGRGLGYFGSSTGGAAALVAAAELGTVIDAVVSRGGRPDLAGPALTRVESPTLLIVGERDEVVLELNREAQAALRVRNALRIVPGATHLFEEPGALEIVARWAAEWFLEHLQPR